MNKEVKDKMTDHITKLPSSSFKNEYGEKFTLYSDGLSVWMSGDEVTAMVDDKNKINGIMPLFNPAFTVWSREELGKLGKALIELSK